MKRYKQMFGALLIVCILSVVLSATVWAAEETDQNGDGYHDGDVAVINAIIENNGLDWTKDDPASWPAEPNMIGLQWSDESVKRVTELLICRLPIWGKLDVSALSELTVLDCGSTWLTERDYPKFCVNLHCGVE